MNNLKSRRTHILCTAVLCLCGGCRSVSTMTFHQPKLQGRQQQMDLATAQTYWASDGHIERILAELPLPGATSGRPMFLLYLRVTPALAAPSRGSPAAYDVHGFLIQVRGEYAGRVDVSAAHLTPVHVNSSRHELDFEVSLEDGGRLAGRLKAVRGESHLSAFETQQHPADVQSLRRSGS